MLLPSTAVLRSTASRLCAAALRARSLAPDPSGIAARRGAWCAPSAGGTRSDRGGTARGLWRLDLARRRKHGGSPRSCTIVHGPHRWCASGLKRVRSKRRSEEHTSELQSLMRISYAVLCLKKKNNQKYHIQ